MLVDLYIMHSFVGIQSPESSTDRVAFYGTYQFNQCCTLFGRYASEILLRDMIIFQYTHEDQEKHSMPSRVYRVTN